MNTKKYALAGAMASALLIAACSTTGSSGGGPSSAAGGGSASGGSDSGGVAAAKAFLAQYEGAPSSIGAGLTPLSRRPAPGKLIVGFNDGNGTSTLLSQAAAHAASVLGWRYKVLNEGFTPDSMQKAFETAVSLNPDGILASGDFLYSTIKNQLQEAAAKHIAVVQYASPNPSVQSPTTFYDTSIARPDQLLAEEGKLLGAFVVAHSNGNAHVQAFTTPWIPPLLSYDAGFKTALAQWCPACTYQANPTLGTDIGTKIPGAVVSVLQRNPNTNYVEFAVGDLTQGVDTALKAAGISGVNIIGHGETPANITATAAGTEAAWTTYPYEISSFRAIDSLARHFNGDPILHVQVPFQIITQANAKSLPLDSQGFWDGVPDYVAQFQRLWHVS